MTDNTGLLSTGPALFPDPDGVETGVVRGSGSPEGVITGTPGKVYEDIAATNGLPLWYKRSGSGNTGWESLTSAIVAQVPSFAGATAGDKIIAALSAYSGGAGNSPVVLDMRGFTGVQVIDKNIVDFAVFIYSIKPIVWLWGSAEYWIAVTQKAMTNHIHILHGAKLVFGKNGDGSRNIHQFGFSAILGQTSAQASTTAGSGTITLTGGNATNLKAAIVPGHGIGIFGHIPRGGRDDTTLTADPGSGGTTLAVVSTTGFPSSGYLVLPNNAGTNYEVVQYASKDATNFLSCTRGYGGTTAVVHNVATVVNRAVYETFIVKSISDTTVVLDEGRTVPFTATLMDLQAGPYGFVIDGHGIIDGNMDSSTDDTFNPQGVYLWVARHCYVGPGITFSNWDHSGVALFASQDCRVYCRVIDSTRPSLQLGSATWLFGNCKRNIVEIIAENCYLGCYIDSRTTSAQLIDGPSDNNVVVIRHARRLNNPIRISGGRGNRCHVQTAVDMPATDSYGIAEDGDGQWITPANGLAYAQHNILIVDAIEGAAGTLAVSVSSTFSNNNVVISRTPGVPLSIPAAITDIDVQGPKGRFTLTDAATIATNASLGETPEVTLGGNRTMGAPTNLWKGKRLRYVVIQDGTGGRTLAWNAVFKQAWSDTGNTAGKRSTIDFYCYDGTNLVQVGAQGPYL